MAIRVLRRPKFQIQFNSILELTQEFPNSKFQQFSTNPKKSPIAIPQRSLDKNLISLSGLFRSFFKERLNSFRYAFPSGCFTLTNESFHYNQLAWHESVDLWSFPALGNYSVVKASWWCEIEFLLWDSPQYLVSLVDVASVYSMYSCLSTEVDVILLKTF